MTTKHEAALGALDAAYERAQEVRRNQWAYTYAEEMLVEHWPTIRDALTARGEAIDTLALWAVRYALGRQSYVPWDVTDCLKAWKGALTDKTLTAIIRDVSEAIEHGACAWLVDPDRALWARFIAALADPAPSAPPARRDE